MNARRWLAAVTAATLLAGCAAAPEPSPSTPEGIPPITAGPDAILPSAPGIGIIHGADRADVADREDVATSLAAPWDIAWAPNDSMLIPLRDRGEIVRVTDGEAATLTGPGADAIREDLFSRSEAGLLGIVLHPEQSTLLYVYVTHNDGNKVLRMRLTGNTLGPATTILDGIPHASNHDGGRMAFGPDGYLYITTGDAANKPLSQDLNSLAGKILRVVADGTDADGSAAPDNPFGTRIWSYGHRNPQGLGWSPDGRMFACELGQNTQDEINIIVPGANYGWPAKEGMVGAPDGTAPGATVGGYTYPVAVFATSEASPSGLAVTDEAVYMASLRGARVWRAPLQGETIGEPHVLLDDLGRIRHVSWGPDGALYILTNNTDGRGTPRTWDDRVQRIEIAPQE